MRDLALEVEMVLAADADPAVEPVAGALQAGLDIAAGEAGRRPDIVLLGAGGVDVELWWQRPRRRSGPARRRGGLRGRLCGDGEERLAPVLDGAGGEDRLVVAADRADVVGAGDVGGGDHRGDARGGAHGLEVEAREPGMRALGPGHIDFEAAGRLRHVVDVDGLAGDVLRRAVVGQGPGDGDGFRHRPALAGRRSARWWRRCSRHTP